MKKFYLFALCFACVFGSAVSSCSSDDNNDTREDFFPTGELIAIPRNFIKNADNMLGTAHYDLCVNNWYMLDEDDNRYYLFSHQLVPFDSLKEEKILVEDALLQFSGEVYDTDPRWMESVNQWLEWASVNVREYHYPGQWLQSNEKVFALMWPCSIKRVE